MFALSHKSILLVLAASLSATQALACGGGGGFRGGYGGGFGGGYGGGYGGGVSYGHAPSYSQPVYSQPVYSQPVYSQPVYSDPSYSQPQPTYTPSQPTYSQPMASQPSYGQPVGGQPTSMGQPQQQYAQPPQQQQFTQPQQGIGQSQPQATQPQQPAASQPTLTATQSALDALAAFGGDATAPAPAAAGGELVGTFTAAVNGDNRVQLVLNSGGSFQWTANSKGKVSAFSGTYTIAGGQMTLVRSGDNQQLAGSLVTEGNGFRFKLGAASGDGLLFVR